MAGLQGLDPRHQLRRLNDLRHTSQRSDDLRGLPRCDVARGGGLHLSLVTDPDVSGRCFDHVA